MVGPTVFHTQTLALDVTALGQPFMKKGQAKGLGLARPAAEIPDHRHRRLLRRCRNRPRRHRAAEQRDELAPVHCPVPPLLPNERNSTRWTAALWDFCPANDRLGSIASSH